MNKGEPDPTLLYLEALGWQTIVVEFKNLKDQY